MEDSDGALGFRTESIFDGQGRLLSLEDMQADGYRWPSEKSCYVRSTIHHFVEDRFPTWHAVILINVYPFNERATSVNVCKYLDISQRGLLKPSHCLLM